MKDSCWCGCTVDSLDLHYQVNLGGWGNSRSAIEIVKNGVGSVISERFLLKSQTINVMH